MVYSNAGYVNSDAFVNSHDSTFINANNMTVDETIIGEKLDGSVCEVLAKEVQPDQIEAFLQEYPYLK
jgi:hypothetical protein